MDKYKLIADYLNDDVDTIKSNLNEKKLSFSDAMKLMEKYHSEMMKQYDSVIVNGIIFNLKN